MPEWFSLLAGALLGWAFGRARTLIRRVRAELDRERNDAL